MKKRLLIICVALVMTAVVIPIIFSAPIWLLVWLFTGFDIMSTWFDFFIIKPIKKYNLDKD